LSGNSGSCDSIWCGTVAKKRSVGIENNPSRAAAAEKAFKSAVDKGNLSAEEKNRITLKEVRQAPAFLCASERAGEQSERSRDEASTVSTAEILSSWRCNLTFGCRKQGDAFAEGAFEDATHIYMCNVGYSEDMHLRLLEQVDQLSTSIPTHVAYSLLGTHLGCFRARSTPFMLPPFPAFTIILRRSVEVHQVPKAKKLKIIMTITSLHDGERAVPAADLEKAGLTYEGFSPTPTTWDPAGEVTKTHYYCTAKGRELPPLKVCMCKSFRPICFVLAIAVVSSLNTSFEQTVTHVMSMWHAETNALLPECMAIASCVLCVEKIKKMIGMA
jgi:hypothetical protein